MLELILYPQISTTVLTLLIFLIIIILSFHLPKRIKSSSYFSRLAPSRNADNRNSDSPSTSTTIQNSRGKNILISTPILNSSSSTLVDSESFRSNNNNNVISKNKKGFRWNPVRRRKQSLSTSASVSLSSSHGGIELLNRIEASNRSNENEYHIRENEFSLPPRFSSLSIYSQSNSNSTSLPSSPTSTPLYSSHDVELEILSPSEEYQTSRINNHDEEEEINYRTSSESFENIDLSSPVLTQLNFSNLEEEEIPPFPISFISYSPPTIPLPSLPSFSTLTSINTNNDRTIEISNTSTAGSKFGFPPLPPTPPNTPPKLSLSSVLNSNQSSDKSSPESSSSNSKITSKRELNENFPEIQINGISICTNSKSFSFDTDTDTDNYQKGEKDQKGEIILVPMFKPEEVFDHKGVIL